MVDHWQRRRGYGVESALADDDARVRSDGVRSDGVRSEGELRRGEEREEHAEEV